MTTIKTKDIYLLGTKGAVLLLHSFTSTANEMRGLAKHLNAEGYTCLAVNYKGHGASPEVLFESSVDDAWQTAVDALSFLQMQGHEEVIVVGQSLGGVIALRLEQHPACKAIVVMSSPIEERPLDELQLRVQSYAKRYYRFQQQNEEWVAAFIAKHFPRPNDHYIGLQQFIIETKSFVQNVTKPVCLCKGLLDDAVYQQSMDYMARHVSSEHVTTFAYAQSGHLITLGHEREQLYTDVTNFVHTVYKSEVYS